MRYFGDCFATHKHIEHTCLHFSAVFTQRPVMQAEALVVLGISLVEGPLLVARLPNTCDMLLLVAISTCTALCAASELLHWPCSF